MRAQPQTYMDNNTPKLTLEQRIQRLHIDPTPVIVAKVQELHSASVSDATIRRAWRIVDKEMIAAEKAEREAKKKKSRTPQAPAAAAA